MRRFQSVTFSAMAVWHVYHFTRQASLRSALATLGNSGQHTATLGNKKQDSVRSPVLEKLPVRGVSVRRFYFFFLREIFCTAVFLLFLSIMAFLTTATMAIIPITAKMSTIITIVNPICFLLSSKFVRHPRSPRVWRPPLSRSLRSLCRDIKHEKVSFCSDSRVVMITDL